MNLETMAKLSDEQRGYIATVIEDLNSVFTPHKGQLRVGHALFYQGKRKIFLEWGRKAGKSETIAFCLYRLATLFPGSYYYIAPFAKQAREIMWADGRLQNFLPPNLKARYLQGKPNDSEMRIRFKNGSFIKLDGADNYEAYRGVNPHGMVYDEFKDFHPEFHKAMDPNLATHKAPLIIVGTPPEQEDHDFIRLADFCKNNKGGETAYFNYPTWINPHIDKNWLREKKAELFAKGEEDVWYREYEARRVFGGKRAVFPMFESGKHSRQHDVLICEIERDRRKLQWQCIADPAGATVFAVLFRAVNPYTRQVYCLDEIYEDRPAEMTTASMWAKIDRIIQDLNPCYSDWTYIYDEAATWWANEIGALFSYERIDAGWSPTMKASKSKEDGINLIREQFLANKLILSSRCTKLAWEIRNYIKDKNGKIPKINDHLIDCMRYGDMFIGHDLHPRAEPSKSRRPVDPETKRYYTMEEDMYYDRLEKDWTAVYEEF